MSSLRTIAAFVLFASAAFAQDGLVDLPPFQNGCQALADDRYKSAIEHFSKTWKTLEQEEGGEIEKNLVASRLLESMVRNGDSTAAARWMSDHTLLGPTPNTVYWMARALQEEERFVEAAELYQSIAASDPDDFAHERAVCLARSGEVEEAFSLVKERTPKTEAEMLAYARIAMDADEKEAAQKFLQTIKSPDAESILSPSKTSQSGPPVGVNFQKASEKYLSGKFAEAAADFSENAEKQSGRKRSTSRFNAAISALQADDRKLFEEQFESLQSIAPRSPLLADLEYLGGLYLASKGDPKAFTMLNTFIREHPDHSSNAEAQLALAEIQLNQVPARPAAARKIFEGLRLQPLSIPQSERLDYSAVWAEHIDHDSSALISRGESFISDWPRSEYLPDIKMIVAGELNKIGSLESARELFRSVAESFPNSPHADLARFLAAKSSQPTVETANEWKSMAESDGPYAEAALHELGLLFLSVDDFENARAVFRSIMESDEVDPDLRYAAQADLGFSWYAEALANDNDRELLSKAANEFALLSSAPEAPKFWRYNAAVRRGKALEAMGNENVSLEIYRSIVEDKDGSNSLSASPPIDEAEWISRAGFSAIDILRKQEDWEGAIKIADTLALREGPRAIEAARLAERMRLENWVWE